MKTVFFKNEGERDAEEIRHSFVHATRMREKLKAILQDKVDASNKAVRNKDAYGIANWAYLQADAVGYERAMHEVMSLLSNDQGNTSEASTDAESIAASKKRPRGRPRKIPTE